MLSSYSFRSRNLSSMSKRSYNKQKQQQTNCSKIIRTNSSLKNAPSQSPHLSITRYNQPTNSYINNNKNKHTHTHTKSYYPSCCHQQSQISYKSAIVFNNKQNIKQLIYEHNHTLRRQIASLTKIMTCYIALQFIKKYQLVPQDIQCHVSKQATLLNGTSAGLEQGNIICLWDLLHGLMLPSGNDAALCIAESIGRMIKQKQKQKQQKINKNNQNNINKNQCISGRRKYRSNNKLSQSQYHSNNEIDPIKIFIKQMNKKCKQLQLYDTHYSNPHGLSDHQNFSTAKDQLILIQQCLKNNLFCRIINTRLYFGSIRQRGQIWISQIIWQNTNRLLNKGYRGIKTGSTTTAGYCLASWYCIDQHDLIIIILGCASKQERDYHTMRLTKININSKLNK